MSTERELGQLSEAVSGLKDGQDELKASLRSLNDKFDAHLGNYSNLKADVAKVTGTITLVVSLAFAVAKDAIASAFHK